MSLQKSPPTPRIPTSQDDIVWTARTNARGVNDGAADIM